MPPIRAILTDIEGTTSSIDFVKEVLFPYAYQHLPNYVAAHGGDAEVRHWLTQTQVDAGLPADTNDEQLVATLRQWIDQDRKATPLKALQGLIWAEGYRAGAYQAHLYPEVSARLRQWQAAGLKLYVYSSGSIAAQQLFFKYSQEGDLSALFSGYFDTTTGPKRKSASYRAIAAEVGLEPAQILFLSDIVEELDAAAAEGFQTGWLLRGAQALPASAQHPAHRDFDSIVV